MNLSEIYKKIKPATASLAIQVPNSDGKSFKWNVFGSAVCIDPSGIFLTAAHCVIEGKEKDLKEVDYFILLSSFNPDANPAWTAIASKPQHFAFIHQGKILHDISVVKAINKDFIYPYINIHNKLDLEEGQYIGCSGFPVTDIERIEVNPNVFSGVISRIDYKKINNEWVYSDLLIDLSTHQGNSGGPVFNEIGNLIGIISWQELRDTIGDRYPKKVWTNLIHCVPFNLFSDCVSYTKSIPIPDKK